MSSCRLTRPAATTVGRSSLAQTQVDVPAGGTLDVPVTFVAPPDTWADIAVRTTVRARDAAGAQTTAFVEITPGRDTAPVAPYQAWTVPDALLGGLNVASLALGGAPVPAYDPTNEAYLYDDVTPSGSGFYAPFDGTPVTLTNDLAGRRPRAGRRHHRRTAWQPVARSPSRHATSSCCSPPMVSTTRWR